MTLGEGKRRVYMLLDEYSSGGAVQADPDIEAKMADFFDMAQKQAAEIKKIRRSTFLKKDPETGLYPLPGDCMKLICLWKDGSACRRWSLRGGMLKAEGGAETLEIEYFAIPATIGPGTSDDYEFELSEDAAKALPYFVASQQLISDLVMDYAGLYGMYQAMLSTLSPTGSCGHSLVNSFYRR